MWKNFIIVCAIVAVSPLAGCNAVPNEQAAPEKRPTSVPKEAAWVGGPDGGVYVRITSRGPDIHGRIWNDHSGAMIFEGKMTPVGISDFHLSEMQAFSGWDGETLYLPAGGGLQAHR